jgi:hypothetical protein
VLAKTALHLVMLSEAKHPHRTGFLATLGMTTVGRVSYCGIKPPASLRGREATEAIQTRHAVPKMDSSLSLGMTSPVMLSEAKHPHRTGFLATLGMTRKKRAK